MTDTSDLADILHSPLDEPEPPWNWWPLLAGMVAGALIVFAGYRIADSGSEETVAPPVPATTVTEAPPDEPAFREPAEMPFPPGYVALTDTEAARPVYGIVVGDDLVIAVVTVGRRGFEGGAPYEGGEWVLEPVDGEAVRSSNVVFDAFLPGAFSVAFPDPGDDVELASLRLVQRWQRDDRNGDATVPIASLDEPVAIALGNGVTLTLSELVLEGSTGELVWELTGAGDGGEVFLSIRAERDGEVLVDYLPSGQFFFSPDPAVERATTDVMRLQRGGGSGDIADATEVVIDAGVTLIAGIPEDLPLDLTGIPIIRP